MLGLAFALLLLSACGNDDGHQFNSTVHDPPLPTPGMQLRTHTGDPFDLDDYRGNVVALFFGYTFCPDVCPLTLANLRQARAALPEADRDGFQVVMVTVDPERDTPERMADFLARFDSSFIGVTGEPARVHQVLADWGVSAERTEREDGSYLMSHPAFMVLLNRSGQWQLTADYLAPEEQVAGDVRRLMAQPWNEGEPRRAARAVRPETPATAVPGAAATRPEATAIRPEGVFYLALGDGSVVEVEPVSGQARRTLLPPWSEVPSPDPSARDGVLGAREVAFDPETRTLWYADTHEVIRSIRIDTGEPGPEIAHFSDAALPGCGVANAARHVSIDLANRRLIVPTLVGAVLLYDLETAELSDAIAPAFFGTDLVLGGFRHFAADPTTDRVWYATASGDLVEMSMTTQRRTGRVIPVAQQERGAANAYRQMVIEPTSRTLIYQTEDGRLASFDLETLERIEFVAGEALGDLRDVGSIAYDPTGGEIGVRALWARATSRASGSAGNAAIYGWILNGSRRPDRLVAASVSPNVARGAELHVVRRDGDMLSMERLPALDLATGHELALAPGQAHLMLLDLVEPLRAGRSFNVTLRFEHAGERTFEVEVLSDAP